MLDRTAALNGPLDRLAAEAAPCPAAELRVLPAAARIAFRTRDEPAIGRAGAAFGVSLPRMACRSTSAGGRTALWLGPDEWLLTAVAEDAASLFATLAAAVGEAPHALVDVSERSVAIGVEGRQAAVALNAGCPLDLAAAAFPVGMCTRTVLAKTEIILLRTSETAFVVDVWRSFAPYAWAFLEEARREFR